MENKRAHLEMIQDVVTRLAHNSFLLKGWSVVLVSALFALAASESKPVFVYLAYLPVLAFWLLDGYYLRQERLFRKLYDNVRMLPEERIDFGMSTRNLVPNVSSWCKTLLSVSIVLFHGAMLLAIVLVSVLASI